MMTDEKQTMMTPDQAAQRLAVSKRTLASWRETRSGPPYLLTGRVVRYPIHMFEKWMSERLHGDIGS